MGNNGLIDLESWSPASGRHAASIIKFNGLVQCQAAAPVLRKFSSTVATVY